MLSLHTNVAALSAQSSTAFTQKTLTTSMTRLGTGYRINSAMDDAAGLQIATRLNAQIRGMAVAMRNTQNGISMMQTAEGAFKELTNIVLRMKDLATEAYTASTTDNDRTSLQAEYDELGKELANIVGSTTFGGQRLFADAPASVDTAGGLLGTNAIQFQIGSTADETMNVDLSVNLGTLLTNLDGLAATYMTPAAPGTELTGYDPATPDNSMITTLNDALDSIGVVRASLGAWSNRLEHVFNNLSNMSTQNSQARGRIMDVDYAAETANMTKNQLLLQAGTSMLKQSSSMSQLVLSLMQ
jgi:flagellin